MPRFDIVPSSLRTGFYERTAALADFDIPAEFLPSGVEACKVRDWHVSLQDFVAWKEVLNSLELMESAVILYADQNGTFSPYSFLRAARAVAGVELSKPMVFLLFALFDPKMSMRLEHDQFVKLLRAHSVSEAPKIGPNGLQLDLLGKCVADCCKGWMEGTLKD